MRWKKLIENEKIYGDCTNIRGRKEKVIADSQDFLL
jgi:hypothetical protein